ncbi:MAG TPA: hypothetical protein HA348_06445 [Thermoplasmata archaeon]|nr:hypothetical protein [Thermoplasmata archaeon]
MRGIAVSLVLYAIPIIVAIWVIVALCKRYKETKLKDILALIVFFVGITIDNIGIFVYYALVLLNRYPYEFIGSQARLDMTGVAIAWIAASLFAMRILWYEKKSWRVIPPILGATYAIGAWIVPYEVLENADKWCRFHDELVYLSFGTLLPLMILPVICFAFYSIGALNRVEKVKGEMLSLGFAMLAFTLIFELHGMHAFLLPLFHFFITVSFVILYIGFTTPPWFFKRIREKQEEKR